MDNQTGRTGRWPKHWRELLDIRIAVPTLIGLGVLLLVIGSERAIPNFLVLLAIPPLPLIHAWLLAQAWRYMFPPDEANQATRLALRLSAWLTVLTLLAFGLSLLDAAIDLAAVGVVVTAITVTSGVLVAVRAARRRQFTDTFVRQLALATVLLSLVVPAGVGITWAAGLSSTVGRFAWPIIVSVILGFVVYRRGLSRYLDLLDARATLWQQDRLALEILMVFVVMLVPVTLVESGVAQALGAQPGEHVFGECFLPPAQAAACYQRLQQWNQDLQSGVEWEPFYLVPLLVLSLPLLGTFFLWLYTAWISRKFVVKKKRSPLQLHDTPLFRERQWGTLLLWQTVRWLASSIVISTLLVATQNLFAAPNVSSSPMQPVVLLPSAATSAAGSLLRTLTGHTEWANSVAWSPDGKTLATVNADATVRL